MQYPVIRHCALVLLAIAVQSVAQDQSKAALNQNSPGSSSTPVFHTSSRLVLVDVVVSDSHGNPIFGLKPSDFRLREDGKPQRLESFDEHKFPTTTSEAPKHFHLPPHQYTNVPEEEPRGPLTVILFDTLNTPAADQVTARLHMLKFLKSLPSGQRTALFTLGARLRLIQTFTGNSDVLVAAASDLLASPSSLLITEADHQHQEDDAAYRERMMAPSISGGSGAVSLPTSTITNLATQNLRDALADQEKSTIERRIGLTLQSLAALGQMLHGYAGRKNLIWLSGGFPFSIGPNPFGHSDRPDNEHFEVAVHHTADLLSAAQVAVYPIDVGGVRTQGIDLSSTAEGATGVDSSTGIPRFNSTLSRQLTESTEEHATMDDMAEQTGGKAFYGSNDVQTAMQRSVQQGSAYYTLAYSPQDQNWNGKYRHIEVKLLTGGFRLQYRRGYFAMQEPEHSPGESTLKLAAALRPDMPDSTSLYLKAEILPPDDGHPAVRISCLIDAQQVTFTGSKDGGKHAIVDLLAVAWDRKGKDVGHTAQILEGNLSLGQYRSVLRSGLQVSLVVPVSSEPYRVRLGAVDRISQQVGTIDVAFDTH
jgi:VWFA-related protein